MLKRLRQPAVVAEMVAGIILGPTVLGRVPGFTATLFPAESVKVIQIISNFALVMFMAIVGMEIDPASLKNDLKVSAAISLSGIGVPLAASAALAVVFSTPEYSNTSFVILTLFLTVALGMSALPVLARILSERRMLATRLGALAMSIAAVDDILGWCLLATTIALIKATTQLAVLWTLLLTLSELAFTQFVIGPVIRAVAARAQRSGSVNADTFLALVIILLCVSYAAEIVGLSALIGAFQVGLLIPRASHLSHILSEKIEFFTVTILMPLFFTNSGLRTQFGLINSAEVLGYTVLVIVVATASKLLGIMLPALYFRLPARTSGVVAVLMSCKARATRRGRSVAWVAPCARSPPRALTRSLARSRAIARPRPPRA